MTEFLEFPNKQQLDDSNLLFNKNKISADIASLSSMSSLSSASSIRSNPKQKHKIREIGDDSSSFKKQPKKLINPNIQKSKPKPTIKYIEDDEGDEDDDDDDDELDSRSNYSKNDGKDEDDGDEDDEDDEDEDDEGEEDEEEERPRRSMNPVRDELNEKKEILYQLNRLQGKGFKIPNTFTLNSNLEEMRQEYNKILKDKDIDASVRFQRKMLMAFVTGTEYLNTRYDPFKIKLDGWSEQVHENIDDFDDIFEELHLKYKSKGKAMPAELRLFISLSGSAFMFHLTSKMFKESAIPGVEEVLKANPELMKQFQNAAAKQFIYNNISTPKPPVISNTNIGNSNGGNGNSNGGGVNSLFGNSSGLFGMVNNLFSGLNNSTPKPQEMQYKQVKPENDINNIINSVHNKISLNHNDDDSKIETLSISDEEITSIIEDATDIKILKSSTRGRKNNSNRTLNI
jgi:hypothetical protein